MKPYLPILLFATGLAFGESVTNAPSATPAATNAPPPIVATLRLADGSSRKGEVPQPSLATSPLFGEASLPIDTDFGLE